MSFKKRLCAGFLILVVCGTTGCGPILSTHRRSNAEDALAKADSVNAKVLAPYEYTLAQEHLRKADELWGYSEFGLSARYAKFAIEMAEMAAEKAVNDPWTSPLKDESN